MALSKDDRIAMSKKIVTIPDENKTVENVKLQILAQQKVAIENDAVNKALQDPYDEKINAYQAEYNLIDGKLRTTLTEDLINAAAKGENRNGFFLADPEFPIPSVPDGVWKFFAPMSFCYAIGKRNDETYGTEPLGEQPLISTINGLIAQVETYIDATRASGQKCIEVGSCSGETPPGSGIDESTCLANGGTWTVTDTIVPSTEIQAVLNNLKTQIQNWENSLNGQKSAIQIGDNSVPARQVQNQTAYDEIDPVLAIINAWQAIQDFDTTTSLPSDCDAFNSMGYSSFCVGEDNPPQLDEISCVLDNGTWVESFQESKLSPIQIQALKDAITDRSAFLTTRKSQLDGYFGTITQDLNTGELTSFSGWYGDRYLILDSRLNLISGSANGKFGAEKALATQNQIKASNDTAAAAYNLTMKAVKAVAPGVDTNYLNVADASAFNAGDRVYVVADNQEELSGSILEKDGNRVKLSFKVPKKYTLANITRLYKLVNNPI